MEQIIYLDPSDDLLTVRDRLNLAEAERVLVVIPPYSQVLHDRISLQLVQRQAKQLNLQLGVVTRDGELRREAQEVGLTVFSSVERGQQNRSWRLSDEPEDDSVWMPRRSEEAWHAAAARGSAARWASRFARVRQALTWMLLAGVMAALGAAALLIVPDAQVTLIPHNEPIALSMHVALDSTLEQVDLAQARIPAKPVVMEVSGSTQVATTGEKSIPDSTAKGEVVFINQLGAPIDIPRGTAVRTSAFGRVVRFFTLADVTVPGGVGVQAKAPIEAMEPGEGGNVPAGLINDVEGVAAISVKVTNPYGTGGGGIRKVPAVTAVDRDRVRAQLLPELLQKAYFEMQTQLGEQEFIPVESLFINEVLDETYDHFVTEEAPAVSLEMRVRVFGLKIGLHDANMVAYAEMAARVPPGYELIADGLSFQRGQVIAPADAQGDMLVGVSGTGYAAAHLDADQIRRSIAGKSIREATAYLARELPLQTPPEIRVTPSMVGGVPWLPFRIRIEVKTRTS